MLLILCGEISFNKTTARRRLAKIRVSSSGAISGIIRLDVGLDVFVAVVGVVVGGLGLGWGRGVCLFLVGGIWCWCSSRGRVAWVGRVGLCGVYVYALGVRSYVCCTWSATNMIRIVNKRFFSIFILHVFVLIYEFFK